MECIAADAKVLIDSPAWQRDLRVLEELIHGPAVGDARARRRLGYSKGTCGIARARILPLFFPAPVTYLPLQPGKHLREPNSLGISLRHGRRLLPACIGTILGLRTAPDPCGSPELRGGEIFSRLMSFWA